MGTLSPRLDVVDSEDEASRTAAANHPGGRQCSVPGRRRGSLGVRPLPSDRSWPARHSPVTLRFLYLLLTRPQWVVRQWLMTSRRVSGCQAFQKSAWAVYQGPDDREKSEPPLAP